MKNTPTPWYQSGFSIVPKIDALSFPPPVAVVAESFSNMENSANAAFIVRACNAHDDMVVALEDSESALRDACQAIAIYGDNPPGLYLNTLSKVRAALAKAKGEA